MTEKKPFERNSLRDLTEKRYIKKMEHIIVEEGKKLLNSLRINYCIISQKQISKFLEKHSEFKDDFGKTVWHQIKIQHLFDTHVINTFQHQLLIMMKQILNRNSRYILRRDEFDKRYFVMNCFYYPKTMNCLRDQCIASEVCPHYFKNVEGKHAKYRKYADEYQKKKKEKPNVNVVEK